MNRTQPITVQLKNMYTEQELRLAYGSMVNNFGFDDCQ